MGVGMQIRKNTLPSTRQKHVSSDLRMSYVLETLTKAAVNPSMYVCMYLSIRPSVCLICTRLRNTEVEEAVCHHVSEKQQCPTDNIALLHMKT